MINASRHIAIVKKPFIDEILAGRKTVEARLATTRRTPFARAHPGETIHFKQSAGPFRATATITDAHHLSLRSQDQLTELIAQHFHDIAGDAQQHARKYFEHHRKARFATILRFANVTPNTTGPDIPRPHGNAWITIPIAHTDARRSA